MALVGLAVGCSPPRDAGSDPQVVDADGDGFTAAIDCDDADGAVHPDAEDAFYDGVDANCDGADDYDQDADGHRAAGWGADCDDTDPTVSPSAAEIPYDGVDNDCAADTPDDDLDRDGHDRRTDCDEADPTIHRGALERVGDGADSDCDGAPDGSRFGFGDLVWVGPSAPRLAVVGDRVVLAATAEHLSSPAWVPAGADHVGVVIPLDPADHGGPEPDGAPTVWVDASDWVGACDLAADGSDAVWVGGSWSDTSVAELGLVRLEWDVDAWRVEQTVAFDGAVAGLHSDVAVAGGVAWSCAAGPGLVAAARADGGASGVSADGSRGCASSGATFATVDADGAPTTWFADPAPLATPDQPLAAERWVALREHTGTVTAVNDGGGVAVVVGDAAPVGWLAGRDVTDAQAIVEPDSTWLAAVADRGSGPEVLLAWDEGAGVHEAWLSVIVPGGARLVPEAVALALTADRVVVAVSGADVQAGTAVGWVLLGR